MASLDCQNCFFASKRWREEFDIDGKLKFASVPPLYYHDRVEIRGRRGPGHEKLAGCHLPRRIMASGQLSGLEVTAKAAGLAVIPFSTANGVSGCNKSSRCRVALNKTVVDILAAADVAGCDLHPNGRVENR